MSRHGAKADRAVVLRATLHFMSGFITEDAQQREVLDHHCGDFRKFGATFKGMVLEAAD